MVVLTDNPSNAACAAIPSNRRRGRRRGGGGRRLNIGRRLLETEERKNYAREGGAGAAEKNKGVSMSAN